MATHVEFEGILSFELRRIRNNIAARMIQCGEIWSVQNNNLELRQYPRIIRPTLQDMATV